MNQVADATRAAAAAPGKTIFGQPRGLATLFLTEMWERFTYYGMRGVLILCMVDSVARGGLGIDDKTANNAYGLYVGSTYLFGLLGGWIADRLIGSQRAVIGGSLFIIAGNLMLTFGQTQLFFLGLLVIAIGIGLLKPNCSAMVAALYPEGGARRDAGFSAFYMGINLGALIGPILVGWFATWLGYKWGFVLPAVGMAIGLTQFIWTRHYLGRHPGSAQIVTRPNELGRAGVAAEGHRGSWTPIIVLALLVAAVAAAAMSGVLRINAVTLASGASWAMGVLGLGYL